MDWTVSDLMFFGTDVDEFRLEKNLKPEKSLDEIEKLCVDEKLPLFERAVLLADSNYDVQKTWVIDQLPVLLEINRQAVIEKILPKISEAFHGCNVELHRAGSAIYSVIAQEKKVDPSVFATYFLPAILSHFENKNPNIGKFWLTTLLSIIHYLPKEVLKHKMMTVVRLRGQLSQPVPSRQTCCKILSRMGSNLETNWVRQELLSLVKSLAQDVDNDVRETMCGELPLFAKSMGPEACSMFVLPEMVELSRDEEVGVRCAAMEAIVDLIPLLDEVSLEKIVVPLVMELLEEGETGKNMKLRISSCKVIGHYAHDLKGYLSADQCFQMLRLYERLSQTSSIIASESKILSPSLTDGHTSSSNASMASGDSFTPIIFNDDGAECRRLCAYNMPAMMLFADRLKETAKLIVIVKSMTRDKHEKVRRTLASGFHEVVSILGERSNKITKDYAALLHDDNIEVLMAIVEHMPEVIEVLAVAHGLDPKTRQPGLTEIVPSLIHFEQLASKCRQWRLHSDLLENMSSLTKCMTSEQLFYKFFPMCWRCVHRFGPTFSPRSLSTTYVLPVKHAALKTICSYIKYIRKLEQRREICTQFIMECAHHDSHKQRLLFIHVCQIVLENFSRQFFKEQGFFSALLELAKDPSSNVRLKLCSLLSQLKTIILLPTDRDKQQMFESTISMLLMDKDSDTIAAVNCAVKEMAKINYRIQSMVPHSMLEEDLIDRERQEEENQLLRDEELERERDKDVLSAKLSAEFRRGLKGIGGHSPSTARSLASKKLAGPSSKKSSPGVPRKTSGMTLNSASSSHSNSSSPNPSRGGGGKVSSGKASVGASASKRTGGGSSPSLSAGSSSPGLVHKSRSREGISSSASSKSSPGQSSKKSQLSHTTKAPQRGSSYN